MRIIILDTVIKSCTFVRGLFKPHVLRHGMLCTRLISKDDALPEESGNNIGERYSS